jgi:phage terminase large subunit
VAGRRWGKTHGVVIELVLAAIKKKKQKVWYVAPTYSMAKQIAWEKLKEIIPMSWIKGLRNGLAINETTLTITLVNDSKITLKGADRPDALRGVGIHFLALDEFQDFKPGVWEAVLRPTLTDTKGRAIFIGTPKSFNHLYERYSIGQFDENGKKNPQWESWQFRTIDSPFIAASEVEAARGDLDVKTFRQEYEASFETMAGRVYYALPIMIGQDFNIDPMSSVLRQKHGDDIWATGELSLRSSSSEDVCRSLIEEYGWGLLDKSTVYPDPAGANRSSARGESDVQIFREWGFTRILHHRKHPAVRDRLIAVNRLICDAKGDRRLYVDPSCKELIKCFEQLIYKEGTMDPDKTMNIEHMGDAVGYPIEFEWPVKRELAFAGYSH